MLTLDQQRQAPRLILALNTTPTKMGSCTKAAETQKVLEILTGVNARLQSGLAGAWLGPDGSRGKPLDPGDTEEAWARTVTEMMLGTAYSGCGPSYRVTDVDFYDAMLTDAGPYPLTVACQQLTTVGLISRGFDRSHFGHGANAGESKNLPIFQAAGAAWYETASVKSIDEAVKKSPPVGAGSVYEFYNKGQPNTGPAHIGFLVRVHRVLDGKAWNAVQFIDTGGMNIPNRTTAPGQVIEGYKAFDDPWSDTVPGPGGDTVGLGVLPPSPVGLDVVTRRMAGLWPCGFARLVIKRTSDAALLYATPLLPMHDASGATLNYGPARLLWSLRGLSHRDVMTAGWSVYIPRNKPPGQTAPGISLASAVLKSPRGKTLRDFSSIIPTAPDKPISDVDLLLMHSKHTVDVQGKVKAEIVYGKASNDTSPWGVRSGAVLPPLDQVPAYLRGGET